MLLHDAIELFLGEYRPTTRRSYAQVLDNMQSYISPNRPIEEITPPELLRYLQSVKARPAVTSPATIHKYGKTMKRFFNWCVQYEIIPKSPAKALELPTLKQPVNRDKAMPNDKLEQLLAYTATRPRLHALVTFFADTAARRRGAAGLQWSDINFEEGEATVTEKGDKTRQVWFEAVCALALQHWRIRQKRTRGDYVFSLDGGLIEAAAVAQVFRRAAKEAGIGSWGPHSLRHRKGFQSADKRVAPTDTQILLGHENVETTFKYYPRNTERAKKLAKELGIKPDNNPKIIYIDDRDVRTTGDT